MNSLTKKMGLPKFMQKPHEDSMTKESKDPFISPKGQNPENAVNASANAEELLAALCRLVGAKSPEELISDVKALLMEESEREELERLVDDAITEIKLKFGEVDKEELLENSEFTESLKSGIEPLKAYKIVKMDEIIEKGLGGVQNEQKSNSSGGRVMELGFTPTNSMRTSIDPSKMSLEDIKKIKERVARGEKIAF